jgi:hypothetical protein
MSKIKELVCLTWWGELEVWLEQTDIYGVVFYMIHSAPKADYKKGIGCTITFPAGRGSPEDLEREILGYL